MDVSQNYHSNKAGNKRLKIDVFTKSAAENSFRRREWESEFPLNVTYTVEYLPRRENPSQIWNFNDVLEGFIPEKGYYVVQSQGIYGDGNESYPDQNEYIKDGPNGRYDSCDEATEVCESLKADNMLYFREFILDNAFEMHLKQTCFTITHPTTNVKYELILDEDETDEEDFPTCVDTDSIEPRRFTFESLYDALKEWVAKCYFHLEKSDGKEFDNDDDEVDEDDDDVDDEEEENSQSENGWELTYVDSDPDAKKIAWIDVLRDFCDDDEYLKWIYEGLKLKAQHASSCQ